MGWVTQVPKPSRPMAWTDDKIRFLWSSDEHIPASMTSLNVPALRSAVDDCNAWLPNAYISTGDLGNSRVSDVEQAMSQLWRVQRPFYFCIGNHDENELSAGVQDTTLVAGETALNHSAPFYYSLQLTSGDGTAKALCLFLDCNFYDDDPTPGDAPGNAAGYAPGDRMGNTGAVDGSIPSGGFYKQFTAQQRAWIAATLAADTDSQMALVFAHYPPAGGSRVTNYAALADTLQADGRPTIGFCGHLHTSAQGFTVAATNALRTYTFYQLPAMLDSYCWCRVTLSWSGSAIVIDAMEIHNFTQPGALTINAPFTSV